VTLVKFDSDLELHGSELTLNHLLQKYSIEQRMNFVINRDRGEIIDINDGKIIETFGKSEMGRVSKSSQAILHERREGANKEVMMGYEVHSMPLINNHANLKESEEKSNNVWDDYWDQS
jgi:hypothetical protein